MSSFFSARRYASAGTSYGTVSACVCVCVCVCLSVCLSVTSRCSVEVVERIELVFGTEASFDQSSFTPALRCKEMPGMYKNKGTPSRTFPKLRT